MKAGDIVFPTKGFRVTFLVNINLGWENAADLQQKQAYSVSYGLNDSCAIMLLIDTKHKMEYFLGPNSLERSNKKLIEKGVWKVLIEEKTYFMCFDEDDWNILRK
jgi:hypothetical protein